MSEVNVIEFRDIVGFPGYRVGNDGTVWTCKKFVGPPQWWILSDEWKQLRHKMVKGYKRVVLKNYGHIREFSIHTLVLEAFVCPRPQGMVARHFPDNNTLNNRVENLSWSTQAENIADKEVHGTNANGERNGNARFTEKEIREMRELYKQGIPQHKIASKFGTYQAVVQGIVTRKTWKHVE